MKSLSFSLPLVAVSLLAAIFVPMAAMAEMKTLSGTVAYRERIALPPSASIEVKLLDVSHADAPARTIAQTIVRPETQVPVPYRLDYDASEVVPGRSYALQARITVGERLWFVTATRHPVFAGGADSTDIVVERVSGAATSPVGRWLAEDIRSGGVIDRLQTILEIATDGKVAGTGGCNRMAGMATISGADIRFGPLAATNMACTPAAMDQEAKFFAALQDVRSWQIDSARRKLTLLDESGRPIIVLAER